MSLVVLRYHEITLKKRNRMQFAMRLARNVERACRDLPLRALGDRHGRLVGELDADEAWPEVRARLERVYGIANFSLAIRTPIEGDAEAALARVGERVLAELEGRRFDSFRVLTRRADKRFPVPSPEVSARIGAAIHERSGARVDLDHGELTLTLEILPGEILHTWERIPGPGGLPVGSSGRVLALLSGGIDSPVAAARMLRRGCEVVFVHFHSAPYVDRTSQEKARELVRRLAPRALDARLFLVPFAPVQRAIVTHVPPPPRVVLYRRMMMRIASEIARRIGAEGLVTGDSLAQVASQTLRNLAVVEDAADVLVLRPLVGMDKLEVTEEAERLGTYEVSIEPDQDCCSLFTPKHPTTGARLGTIRALESRLDLPRLVEAALAATEIERFRFPPRSVEPEREDRARWLGPETAAAPAPPGDA